MRKRFVLLLICAVGLLLAACAPGEAEDSGVMEEIRSAPVVKLEYAGQEGGGPVFCYDPVSMSSLAEMRIQPSQGEFTEDWVYRFTYNPREKVIDGLDAHFTGRSDVIPVERKRDGQPGARSSLLSGGEFKVISDYVNLKIRQIGTEILEGRIPLNPYRQAGGGQGACTYCPYSRVCGFDRRIPGYEDRTLEKLEEKEALRRMEQALKETQEAPERTGR